MQFKILTFRLISGILSVLAVIVAFRMATKESNRNLNGMLYLFLSRACGNGAGAWRWGMGWKRG